MEDLSPIDTPWQGFGSLLIELVQLYSQASDPCVLVCEHPSNGVATLAVDAGHVVHARHNSLTGEEAFFSILRWRSGQIKRRTKDRLPRNIEQSLSNLILDAYWELESDEISEVFEANGIISTDREAMLATVELDYRAEDAERMTRAGSRRILEKIRQEFFFNEEIKRRLADLAGIMGFELLSQRGELLMRVDLSDQAASVTSPTPLLESLGSLEIDSTRFELMLCLDGIHHVVVFREHLGLLVHAFFEADKIKLGMAKWHMENALKTPIFL